MIKGARGVMMPLHVLRGALHFCSRADAPFVRVTTPEYKSVIDCFTGSLGSRYNLIAGRYADVHILGNGLHCTQQPTDTLRNV